MQRANWFHKLTTRLIRALSRSSLNCAIPSPPPPPESIDSRVDEIFSYVLALKLKNLLRRGLAGTLPPCKPLGYRSSMLNTS